MAISVPSVFVSTGDMSPIRNSLDALFELQLANGMLPYAGFPLGSTPSWTYHLANLIGVDAYYTYTGDKDYLLSIFDKFKLGIAWSQSSIDSSGMMNVGAPSDWLRSGMGGHVSCPLSYSTIPLIDSIIEHRSQLHLRLHPQTRSLPRWNPWR